MNLNEDAFIIHKIPYQENSEILTVITHDGIKKIIAKGVKKHTSKNKSACEIGNYVNIELLKGKSFYILKSIKLLNYSLEWNLENLLITQLCCELSYRLNYDNMQTMLLMNQLSGYHKLLYFLYHIAKENGLQFEVSKCVRTTQKETIAISINDGGLVSKDALKNEDIILSHHHQVILKVLPRVTSETLEKYKLLAVDYQLCQLYIKLISQQLGVTSKITNYIEEINKNGKSI